MSKPNYDRVPTSEPERLRWRATNHVVRAMRGADPAPDDLLVALAATDGLAAEMAWAHNVMVAAREQASLAAANADA